MLLSVPENTTLTPKPPSLVVAPSNTTSSPGIPPLVMRHFGHGQFLFSFSFIF